MGKTGLLGELEQLILLSVVGLGEEGAYAVAIHQDLKKRTGLGFSLGSIYVTLDRLHRKGLLKSDFADPLPQRGGKSRRMFSITEQGSEVLRRSRQAIESMWKAAEPNWENP